MGHFEELEEVGLLGRRDGAADEAVEVVVVALDKCRFDDDDDVWMPPVAGLGTELERENAGGWDRDDCCACDGEVGSAIGRIIDVV